MSELSAKKDWRYPNLPPKHFIYKSTPSHLDEGSPGSSLNMSRLRGLYNLFLIFAIIFFVTQPIINFIDKGYFLESTLYNQFKVDLIFCVVNWPLFFLWSFTSYFLQVLILKGLNPILATILQHGTQSGLFAYSTYIIFKNDWCSTHTVFVIIQAVAHFMKMHSYITVNRDLREDYEEALRRGERPQSNYPNNVTISDFCLFMFTPWLVYAEYPRRKSIDYFYVGKKVVMAAVLLITLYLIHSEFIQPWIHRANEIAGIELVLRLMLPILIFFLTCFYLVFDTMCNFFAEITRLDHREFYEDWWNSHTYQEFNRKWNKPVHLFLFRHVYLECMIRWKTSKVTAQAVTFLFSAFLHQFLLAVLFRIVRPILLMFMLFQIPLIKFTKWMQRSRGGLYLVWFGLILGPSLILSSYLFADQKVMLMFARK